MNTFAACAKGQFGQYSAVHTAAAVPSSCMTYMAGYIAGNARSPAASAAPSQQRSRKGRSRLQAPRLRMFLTSPPDDTKAPARQPFMSRRVYDRFIARMQRLEAQAHSRRRQKPITKQLSYKLLRPIAAYDSERYALF